MSENNASTPLKTHPLDSPQYWTDPATEFLIPKALEENLEAREWLLEAAMGNESEQEKLIEYCGQSIHLWLNLFGWTYVVKAVDDNGKEVPASEHHVPFLTWPVQDQIITELSSCIDNGVDVILDKSRDMGASWLTVSLATWYWLFRKDAQVMLVSRVEDMVDRRGDPDTLFWKIDYILERLPEWMLPGEPALFRRGGACRNHMQLTNPKTDATISGQATTGHVGRGGRRTFILFDEMAAMDHATDAWRAAADTTACRIGNSTPIGPGTEFTNQRNLGLIDGRPHILTMGYWDHPEKGRSRKWMVDEDGALTGIAGRGYYSSPWFDVEVRRRKDPADIGQNILIDHTTSGDLFYNSITVTQHLKQNGRESLRCELENGKFVPDARGRWFVWCDLNEGLPELDCNFVMFADISAGKGKSNSAVAAMDCNTGQIVAEFVDANTGPLELSEEVVAAGRTVFAGSSEEAFLGWEAAGPGEAWYEDIRRLDYTRVYFRRQLGKKTNRKSKDYGWKPDRKSKRIFLSGLARAMATDQITIHSKRGLGEMLEYVYFDTGAIGPGSLREETTGAKEAHGDRVIAYAGCVYMRSEAPKFEGARTNYAPDSMGAVLNHEDVWENPDG